MHLTKKNGETVLIIGGVAFIIWLLSDARHNVPAVLGAVGGAISGGLQDLGANLGGMAWDFANYDWSKHPDEAIWELPYWKLTTKQYRAWFGSKPRIMNFAAGKLDMPPAARLTCNLITYLTAPHVAGTLKPRPGAGQYSLHYNRGNAGSLRGDPRALYALDHLMRISGLTRLDHMGILPAAIAGPGLAGDFGHNSGAAIDLLEPAQTNALINAAKIAHMPVCWISRTNDGNGWPVYMLAEGIKVGPIGHSPKNHNDHEHFMLPRPNWASNFWNK